MLSLLNSKEKLNYPPLVVMNLSVNSIKPPLANNHESKRVYKNLTKHSYSFAVKAQVIWFIYNSLPISGYVGYGIDISSHSTGDWSLEFSVLRLAAIQMSSWSLHCR